MIIPTTRETDHRRKLYLVLVLLVSVILLSFVLQTTENRLIWKQMPSPGASLNLALVVSDRQHNKGPKGSPSPTLSSPAPPRTLLIIQGAYRTFDFTVDSIISNLIETNWPCEVVVSLDKRPPKEDDEHSYPALQKLKPYLLQDAAGVLYPLPKEDFLPATATALEFIQHHRALTRVNLSSYEFIMKTRTDVAVQQPMRFTTALGRNETAFKSTFPRFVEDLLDYDPESTPEDVIYIWYMTAGNPFYIRHMSTKRNIHMAWSPVGPHDVNHPLREAVTKECQAVFGGGWGEDNEQEKEGGEEKTWSLLRMADAAVLRLVQKVAQEQHVMYMAGNTWIGFGVKEDFVPVYETIYHDFGKLSWNQWRGPGWNGSHQWLHGDHITESHFRLSHLHHNKSLVDLMNLVDHQVTFVLQEQCFGHLYLRSATGLAVYIMRERQVTCLPDRLPIQALDPHEIYEVYEYHRL